MIGHQLKTLHLSVLLRHPADKHHHGAFVFRLQIIDNALMYFQSSKLYNNKVYNKKF